MAVQPRMFDDPPVPPGFARFWSAYPSARRADKRRCALLWAGRGYEAQADAIVQWAQQMCGCDQWRRGIVPLAYTTLHQARWMAGLPPDVAGPKAELQRTRDLLAEQARHAAQLAAGPSSQGQQAIGQARALRDRLRAQVAASQLRGVVQEQGAAQRPQGP